MNIWNLSGFLKSKYLKICPYGKKQLDILVQRCLRNTIMFLVAAVVVVIVWNGMFQFESGIYFFESIVLTVYLVFTEVPNYCLLEKENQLLHASMLYFSRVKHHYMSSRHIANAIVSAAEGMEHEVERLSMEMYRLLIVLREGEEQKKQLIADSFSEAIYISMGYLETPVPKEFWRLYVPMLVLVEEDGAYFYHVQTGQAEGEKELYHVWTDKFLFSFPEGCNDIKKKSLMANVLEQKASEIITEHNSIALQHGISYQYYLPGFFQNTLQLPEFPMLFVVFQGWPLNCFSVFYDACFEVGVFMHYKGNMESDYPKLIDP